MRILFLSFYFEPDLSAGSFRNTALVKELLKQLPEKSVVDVFSTLPNRYSSFSIEAHESEVHDVLTIHRIALPKHNSGMLDQSKAFFTYAKKVVRMTEDKNYDLVYASSSRLMTAFLGAHIASKKKLPLYLDIRDIFLETITDVLPSKFSWITSLAFNAIEKWTFNRATKINIVSEGFLPYFRERYPKKKLSVFSNGIDEVFLCSGASLSSPNKGELIQVVYAGNFGESQGLHNIIPDLALKLHGRVKFKLIGSGGRITQLKSALFEAGCTNVELCSPLERIALIEEYKKADVLFLHLNDHSAFRRVLPSKLFEYAAMGKPIWAGVTGYAAEFIHKNITNAVAFEPCNSMQAIKSFDSLNIKFDVREEFLSKFARKNIMKEMARDVILTSENKLV